MNHSLAPSAVLHNFEFDILDLGLIEYQRCYAWQQELVESVSLGRKKSALLLCEHPPVITLGRRAKKENILKPLNELTSQGIAIAYVTRGGDVTLHLPGQLVVYPVFDLRFLGRDITAFLRNLEKAIIFFLHDYGIAAKRKEGLTGAWVDEKKIASIGIAIRHWVTYHGLSVNIDCDLNLFSLLRSCGQDIMMASIKDFTGEDIDREKVKEGIVAKFRQVFCGGG